MRREFVVVGIIIAALAALAWYWKKKTDAGGDLFISQSGIGGTDTDLQNMIEDQKVSAVVTAPMPSGPATMSAAEIHPESKQWVIRSRFFAPMVQ